MIPSRALEAIEASDTDELLRVVDGLCEARDWEGLDLLRHRCREAVARGKQLWGVEENIRYRMALEAPPRWAASAIDGAPARFAPGPLPEVAAGTKTWAETSPFLGDGPQRDTFAAERVVRGEPVDLADTDLPGELTAWEPRYPLPNYRSDGVDEPAPDMPSFADHHVPRRGEPISDLHSEGALYDLVKAWVEESNGNSEVVAVEGEAIAAIGALGPSRVRLARISPAEAMEWMAWAGASGGAFGRRRGAAAGRYGAWWAVATIADLDWPADPGEVGEAAGRLRWSLFDDGSLGLGWALQMAVEDPVSGLSWAITASDSVEA